MPSSRMSGAAVGAFLLFTAACSDDRSITGPPPQFTTVDSSQLRIADPALVLSRFAALSQAGITLQQGDGFEVTLVARECAAQGNTFSVTSPASAVITSNGCAAAIGTTRTFSGPYAAGTNVTFSFFSGYTGSPGQIQVTGAYPNWTVSCEDGFDNDFNDLVFSVRAVASCATNDPVLDDPGVRQQMKNLLQQSGAFNNSPSARREMGGYMYQQPDGSIDIRTNPDPNATPCSMSPGGPTPQTGETVVGVFHTHPFSAMDPLPTNCGRGRNAYYDNATFGGGSRADWELIQTPYLGNHLPMYIIDKDEVYRLDANTPVADRGQNPNRFQWNRPGCQW